MGRLSARLRALHHAALAVAATTPAHPTAVAALLSTIVVSAVAALGARDGRLVLAPYLALPELVDVLEPEQEEPAPTPAGPVAIMLDHTGQLRRTVLRPDGGTMHVFTTGEAVQVRDTLASSRYGSYADLATHGIRALVIHPLRAGGHVLGALSVTFNAPRRLSTEDREILDLFGAHAATALERVRVMSIERLRAFQAEQLAVTLAQVGGAPNLEGTLEALLRGAVALMRADEGVIHLFQTPEGGRRHMLRLDRIAGVVARSAAPSVAPGSHADLLRAGGGSTVVEDFWALDPQTYPFYERMRERGMRSSVNVPIEAHGHRIGSLHVNHHERAFFGPSHLVVAEALAQQAGAAIERAQLEAAREEDLRRMAEQAEEIARREAEAEALRELDLVRDELLATISHELRTPLTVVAGHAQRLRRHAETMDRAAVLRSADEVLAGTARLTRLVEDLSDLGRAERGEVLVQPAAFDLVPVLQDVLAGIRTGLGTDQIVADLPPSLPVFADRDRTVQIVSNLLTNAARYAPGEPILLWGGPSQERDGYVRVVVEDNGPGIPLQEQESIWELFTRGQHALRRKASVGSGIGLAVVKQLVEAQHGRVSVESEPGKGSRFWFELPARALDDPDPA